MRQFQIDIKFFYIHEDKDSRDIRVYADSNDAWQTICAGFYELIDTLRREGLMKLPTFGRMEHRWMPTK